MKSSQLFSVRRNLLIIISFIITVLLYKFYTIQINNYEKYNTKGSHNSLRKIISKAPRGIIYDRNNMPLVDNRPIYSMSLIPFDAKFFNFSLFHEITGIDSTSVKRIISSHSNRRTKFKPIIIKDHIGFNDRSIIEEYKLDFPGIRFTSFPARIYPSNANMSHLLGYLRKVTKDVLELDGNKNIYKADDVFGFSGVEKIYETNLKGDDGVEFHIVDVVGVEHGILKTKDDYPVVSGQNLQLTIDVNMQVLAENLLSGKKGAIISMNPANGDIYALASSPVFDLASFIGPIPYGKWNELRSNVDNPLLNRGIQGLYPPGSIFKLILAAYALENKIIDSNWSINCAGAIEFGDRIFKCWNEHGHGDVNLNESIVNSCNIFYYNLIQKVPFNQWTKIVEEFGFGNKTQIDLPNEKVGIVPSRSYMDDTYGRWGWGKGSLLNFAIGQGDVLVTPIQIIQIINAISMKGKVFQPKLNNNIDSSFRHVDLSLNTWLNLNKTIFNTVNSSSGTGYRAKLEIDNAKVYGKTSTSQNPHGETHSGFAGYIELLDNKKMSIVVIVENGGKGSGVATEFANKLFRYFAHNY